MTPCWGNRPVVGKCKDEAIHFFKSHMIATIGSTPRHRAVCEDCYQRYRFKQWVDRGILSEVPYEEWRTLQ